MSGKRSSLGSVSSEHSSELLVRELTDSTQLVETDKFTRESQLIEEARNENL